MIDASRNVIIDTPRNRAAYGRLVELVRSARALAFIGAGVSFPLGYPDWETLIGRLAAEVRASRGEAIQSNGLAITVDQVLRELKKERLAQAHIFKNNLGAQYFPILGELFGIKEQRIAPITNLVALPFKHLLTSNYDPGLEQHHQPPNQPGSICLHHDSAPQFITHFADDNYNRRVVHVHGRYDEPRHIILTEDDYGTYIRSAVVDQFWRSVPVNARFVFFGFSFDDNDLLYSFRRLELTFRGNNQEEDARHFAVLPLDNAERENPKTVLLRMRYGIEPVFYPHPGTDFAEYDEFISALNRDVLDKIPQPLAEQIAIPVVRPVPEAGPLPPEAAPIQAASAEAVQAGIESLRNMTRLNIARRQTGDLE